MKGKIVFENGSEHFIEEDKDMTKKLHNVRIGSGSNPTLVTRIFDDGSEETTEVDNHSKAYEIYEMIETEHTTVDPDYEKKSINIVAHTVL